MLAVSLADAGVGNINGSFFRVARDAEVRTAVKIRKSSFGPHSRIERSAPDALDSATFVTRATPLTEPQAENSVKIDRPQLRAQRRCRTSALHTFSLRIRENLAANL
jgi:hypothetical protein